MGEREGKRRQPRKSVFHRLLLFVVGLGGCLGAGVHEGQDLRGIILERGQRPGCALQFDRNQCSLGACSLLGDLIKPGGLCKGS